MHTQGKFTQVNKEEIHNTHVYKKIQPTAAYNESEFQLWSLLDIPINSGNVGHNRMAPLDFAHWQTQYFLLDKREHLFSLAMIFKIEYVLCTQKVKTVDTTLCTQLTKTR